MKAPIDILKQFWRYDQFRPQQEEIIQSVLSGTDTLALLPTGGGKSVCYQIPGLMRGGITLVITPLIALMKDQVEQLVKKDISAVAVHAGLSKKQIDILLDNCIYGNVKFLYLSPERIHTELFEARVKQMKVNLVAVDEAHCISQWGHDFRPAYRQIAWLREWLPNTPFLALTATATKVVQADIQQQLKFSSSAKVFRQSFARDNLSLVCRKSESKERKLLESLRRISGQVIVYVRSRKATESLSQWLSTQGIPATHYHAGLTHDVRAVHQDKWFTNQSRVMVATNAFGMGLDKRDVRLVIHLDLPENLEAYFQEAGRAGRDGNRSYALVLFHDGDLLSLKTKVEQSQPSVEYLSRVYQGLANLYQLAVGSGEGESFDFDISSFADQYSFHQGEVYNALKKLEEAGLLEFNESYYSPSVAFFKQDKAALYAFQVAHARFDPLIKIMLRLYGGELFSGFVKISETYIARALNMQLKEVKLLLKQLDELDVMLYQPMKDSPQIAFTLPRQDAARLPLDVNRLNERRKLVMQKMEAMIEWVTAKTQCRMMAIQQYFGEETETSCGLCDVCVDQRNAVKDSDYPALQREILTVVGRKPILIEELEDQITPDDHDIFVELIRLMVDRGDLEYDSVWRLTLKTK